MSKTPENQLELLRALADPTRLRLLRLLAQEELNVQEITRILDIAQPNVSRHLGMLRASGLLREKRDGTRNFCRLLLLPETPDWLQDFVRSLHNLEHPDMQKLRDVIAERSAISRNFADNCAERWDDIGQGLQRSAALLAAFAGLMQPVETLADLGTGTGLLLPSLANCAQNIIAVDQSGEMLRRARERCVAQKITNVNFLQVNLENVSQENFKCDAALLHFVLHQVARPRLVLSAIRQILKPGGRLVIVDRLPHDDETAKSELGSVWLGFSEEQLTELLKTAGFTEIKFNAIAVPSETTTPDLLVSIAT